MCVRVCAVTQSPAVRQKKNISAAVHDATSSKLFFIACEKLKLIDRVQKHKNTERSCSVSGVCVCVCVCVTAFMCSYASMEA